MPRRTKEEAEETRKAILRASLEIFCEKGYSRTTFDEIAKHINLTKGAIYWHFRNKADILTEIIRERLTLGYKTIEEKINPAKGIAAIKDFMLLEAELIKTEQLYRQLGFFLLYQMEWSEAILNKVTNEVYDVIQHPKIIIKKILLQAQEKKE
ncbi:MAG: TetR family transcriptional regulator, partial [Pseudomonadota bacterium]|nr:TetR family transcriptional regulator [Pseudomonadota bacterium]